MITIKNNKQIALMREAGKIVRDVLCEVTSRIVEGVTTQELDRVARQYIEKHKGVPSFLNYNGFPASLCVSINDEVVHGIPSYKRVILNGDIVSIDVGVLLNGYHGDAARTIPVGAVTEDKLKLIKVCEESFFYGIEALRDGARMGDMSSRIQHYAESNGFSVVRSLIGHGIGTSIHEEPDVPNYGVSGRGIRLKEGMTIAIEPMINLGGYEITLDEDDWTVRTKDGRPSAHYENTVAITKDGYEILTL